MRISINLNTVDKYFYLQHQKTLKELAQAALFGKKTLEQVHALKNISFSIGGGEQVGIIGKNGAGKSTLLKLIAGVSQPTTGSISVTGRVVPLIELGAGFHPELTGLENIYLNGVILGFSEREIKERINDIVAFAEIPDFIDVPVKFYSSGMYIRLAFSVAIFVNPEILLLDEVLAVGDRGFQKKCLRKMDEFKQRGVTMILVSHSQKAIKEFCTRVLYLKNGALIHDGEVDKGLELYDAE
ncbi:MAG: ABC transporter ATP-binding protein [Patescibacteria group bacterium]